MSRARELAKVGGLNQQVISGLSTHVGISTFAADVLMYEDLTVTGNAAVGGNLTVTGTTTFNGGTLTLGDAATDNVVFGGDVNSNIIPNTDNAYDLGSSSQEWKDLYVDGTANIDSLVADTADINGGTVDGATVGANSASTGAFTTISASGNVDFNGDLDVDGTTNLDAVDIDGAVDMASTLGVTGTTTLAGQLSANGDVDLGNATSDTITATGRFDSDLVPSGDNARDLGTSSLEWKDLYLDGTANIDSLVADTADINGGTADNVVIGGSTAAAGSFTTVAASSNLTVSGNGSVTGTFDVDGATTLDGLTVAEGATFSTTLGVTGTTTLAGQLDANGDVNLGNAATDSITVTGRFDSALIPLTDNAVDLGTSSLEYKDLYLDGTANIDSLVADTADINGGTIDAAVIGGSTAAAGSFTTVAASSNATITGNLDVDGATTLDGLTVAEGATFSNNVAVTGTLDVDGATTLDGLTVAEAAAFSAGVTITGALDANGGASIDNVQIGVTNDNEIDTASGNLVIDSAGGTTTVDDNLTVSGNLTVNGTTTTINSTTVAIDDKNFQVATGAADDAAADGGGLTVDSGDGDKTWNFEATGDNWGSSENINIASGKSYKINNTAVLNATTLGSSVVASSLTSVGTIASGTWNGSAITNTYLQNSSVSYGGVALSLGTTDATPAFDLTDATNYPTSSLTGTITNAQLAGSIANSKLAGSITNSKLSNSSVSYGGVSLSLGGSDGTPAFDLSDATNYPTSSLTGTITNAQLAGSIANSKLSTISTANKVSLSALNIDGGTDIGAALADADLFIVDDGAGGTNRSITASAVKTYMGAAGGAFSVANLDIDGATDIGAAIVDADEIIIDDGGGGTNRRSDMSRVKTYIYGATSGDATASSGGAITLAASGVSAATYGSSSAIPIVTVDAKGRITSATTTAIDSTTISNGTSSVAVANSGDVTTTREGTTRIVAGSTGVELYGVTEQNGHMKFRDDDELRFGAGTDGTISSDGSNFLVQGSGTTYLRGPTVYISANGGSGGYNNAITVSEDSGSTEHVILKHGSTTRLTTTSSGLTLTGTTTGTFSGNVTGDLTGDVLGDVTGNADTATLATNVTVSANNNTDETVYPVFVDGATGTQGLESDTGFSFNPSSGIITAGGLACASLDISGNADIDGTMEADAYTVNGTALSTYIAGITVTTASTAANAQLLDSLDSSQFLRSDASDTFTGTLTVSGAAAVDNLSLNGNTLTTSSGNLTLDSSGGTVSVADNLTISGNLTVNGTTTTVDTTNTNVSDNLLELNSGAGSNSNDSGIIIERGSTGDNAIIAWDESADKFTVGTTTATNDATGNISITTGTLVANIEGNVTGNVTGNTSGSSGSCTGNAATATILANARTIAGVSFNGSANISLNNNAITNGAGYITSSGTSAACSGNAATATLASTSTITANNSTSETVYLTFVDGATGTQGLETDTGLNYNPSSNNLTAGTLTGYHVGNSDGNVTGSSGSCTGNAATATALASARTIAGVSFDGTGNISLNNNAITNGAGYITSSGTSAACSGNAATATKLAATKTIAGVAFDGSSNISLNNNAITNGAGYITSADGGNADTVDSLHASSFVRSDTSDTMSGTLTMSGNIVPNADSSRDLGTNSVRWANVYADDLRAGDIHLSNEHRSGGNEIDGSWGSYVMQEGEHDLFLKNTRTGKSYKFMLQEV